MRQEYELIEHGIIADFRVFILNMKYRGPHMHSDFEICIVLDGEVTVSSDDETGTFHAGSFYIINPYCMHELKAAESAVLLSIQIKKNFCTGYYPGINELGFELCEGNKYMDAGENAGFIRKAVTLSKHYFLCDKGFEFICTGLLNELMYVMINRLPYVIYSQDEKKRLQGKYRRVQKITEYINGHYTEKILLGDIAAAEGLTLTYLSHFFNNAFHMSFQQYVAILRCEKARQILLLTDHNLLDISMEAGFSDVKYLNKEFIRQYGCHPREYRKKAVLQDIPEQKQTFLTAQKVYGSGEALAMLDKMYPEIKVCGDIGGG